MPTLTSHRRATVALAAFAVLGLGAAACGDDDAPAPAAAVRETPPAQASPAPASPVPVIAGEWYFRAPSRLRPGPTTFTFRNEGRRTHQLAIARLAPGVSMERAIAMGGTGGTAVPLGEVVARPGVTGELHADLRPGRHVLVCFEENGGRPHHARGQRATILVR